MLCHYYSPLTFLSYQYIEKLYTSTIASTFTYLFFFFFQAEDGIRDSSVTGVQTCALPIWMGLLTSALDVYFRDMRYIVESANRILFWVVPIFYSFAVIPKKYHLIYQLNPVSAVVLATRNILLDGKAPPQSLLWKLLAVSFFVVAAWAW